MVKIKRKVKMTLAELIEWGFKNNIENRGFVPNQANHRPVVFNSNGWIDFSDDYCYPPGDIFTVEIEEELTENTVLPSVVVVRTQYFPNNGHSVNVAKINSKSIKQVIENQPNNSKFEYHSIYLMESERIGQLIWKDGELVGDE